MRWAFALLALAAVARADGKFMSTQVPVVEIPDQQAILVWHDGHERLVIDTAYAGEGDLAWIVPLPAPPKIEPVSPAVFRTIEVVTMPDVVDRPSEGGWEFGLLLLVAIATMQLVPSGWFVVRVAALAVLFFVLAMLILLGTSAGTPRGEVAVLSRGPAGSYETATLQSVDATAILSWLQENGFKVAPDVRAGIEEYVRDGWVFAVARLKSGGSGGRAHPLSFEFEAKEPVYPMRLTGAQDRALSLRLFVLSDRRAHCDALETESCYRVDPAAGRWPDVLQRGKEREIGQPDLLRLAGDAFVLTTLTGRTPHGQRDLQLGFEKYAPLVPIFHSQRSAVTTALSYAVWIAFFLLLPCHLLVWAIRQRHAEKPWRRVPMGRSGQFLAWCAVLGIGLVTGAVSYLTTDITPMRGGEGDVLDTWEIRSLHRRAQAVCAEAADLDAARAVVGRLWLGRVNPYTGRPVAAEPSPGNYGLELREGKVTYVHYDARGARVGPDDW